MKSNFFIKKVIFFHHFSKVGSIYIQRGKNGCPQHTNNSTKNNKNMEIGILLWVQQWLLTMMVGLAAVILLNSDSSSKKK